MTWRPSEDAWLAGFTDGEGSFHIRQLYDRRDHAPDRFAPAFSITLRADDKAVLEALRAEFGGGFSRSTAGDGRRKPAWSWAITSCKECARLVDYFDRFPLRAKKARDYAIWREAVRIYSVHGGVDPELPVLRAALRAGREYRPEDAPPVPELLREPDPQLPLLRTGVSESKREAA